MKKILYISGSRADYGLMKRTLLLIKRQPIFNLKIVVTGMHLMKKFGNTIKIIQQDGFDFLRVNAVYKEDNKESMVNFLGEFIKLLLKEISRSKPEIILILGDRAEMLGGAIMGSYLQIPVVHIHGGEVTSTVDEHVRHAISKLSHIHLTATQKSKERLIKMGEDEWRIFVVGAPGLDEVLSEKLIEPKEIARRYKLNPQEPILLVLQHPVSLEIKDAPHQIRETMKAIRKLGYQTIVIYPNADPGGREMIKVIEQYRKYDFIQIYKNLPRKNYLSLLRIASVLIGNSSSGIIEAPSFHLPVVNVGTRQEGRERAENVFDVDYKEKNIVKTIKMIVFNNKLRERLKKIKNPYGDGKASERIVGVLKKVKVSDKLLQKRITY